TSPHSRWISQPGRSLVVTMSTDVSLSEWAIDENGRYPTEGYRHVRRPKRSSRSSVAAAVGVPAAPAFARSGGPSVLAGLGLPVKVNTASSPAPSPSQL